MARFPVPAWINTYSIAASPPNFGAKRAGGRLHAGCDLYAPLGSDVLAIGPGKVLRVAAFYWGTDAVEIEHPGIGVVRYGEVVPAPGISKGVSVAEGQIVAFIAQLKNPRPGGVNPHPMLHFELYTGTGQGPLTTAEGSYKRRGDLQNPTNFLKSLYSPSFAKRFTSLVGHCRVPA